MAQFSHKKSLGQNFLRNTAIVEHIAAEAGVSEDDVVVEIGPGQGILTMELARRAKKVIAIELDDRLIPFLKEKCKIYDNVEIVHGDILHMNVKELVAQYASYKVVANIPYYITAPIIRLFLELSHAPQSMTLMVQKEVAERLCASPGNMSVIAVAAQYYADVRYGFTVLRSEFEPMPAVDSAIVSLYGKKSKAENDRDFFRIVKVGFSARRKTLCNNLANGLHMSKEDVVVILHRLGLSENVRAQELSIVQWQDLTHAVSEQR